MAKKNAQVKEATGKTYSGGLKRVRGPLTAEIKLNQPERQELLSGLKSTFKTGSHANSPEVNRRPVKSRMIEANPASDKRS